MSSSSSSCRRSLRPRPRLRLRRPRPRLPDGKAPARCELRKLGPTLVCCMQASGCLSPQVRARWGRLPTDPATHCPISTITNLEWTLAIAIGERVFVLRCHCSIAGRRPSDDKWPEKQISDVTLPLAANHSSSIRIPAKRQAKLGRLINQRRRNNGDQFTRKAHSPARRPAVDFPFVSCCPSKMATSSLRTRASSALRSASLSLPERQYFASQRPGTLVLTFEAIQ